ncbi:acyl-CoA N-acyltransferase [Penicillium taxi]|uniref:acyl-CoA N-acyltransferase n=1 Tax=Penicillium taxi TaxID=168475 RepID=UPI0025459022|nr:acyl-CoA N-acyltransferase [Penicillium taxi]KAJ5894723.1 acyl-CoA N-acyltransferase [Penicillium taxi]
MGSIPPTKPYIIRTHRPGDIGWIIHRLSVLYDQERIRLGTRFEGLVAEIAANFIEDYEPEVERCWVAERDDGHILGSIMLVQDRTSKSNAAKIRLLLVEPTARGLGLGRTLVKTATSFARKVGYARVGLWTQSTLTSARHIYASEGFKLMWRLNMLLLGLRLLVSFGN